MGVKGNQTENCSVAMTKIIREVFHIIKWNLDGTEHFLERSNAQEFGRRGNISLINVIRLP